ncbi:MAG TPA: DUF2550 domain-containing protein [Actinomycetes bacterium]|nr:DUF2550 domain-containing protein [Actinomycetes bacterium]
MTLVLFLDVLVGLVVLALAAVGLLALRRRVITRRGGTFDCSLRLREGQHGKGWVLGIGRYAGDALEWYRVFSYATRPRRTFPRNELRVVESREPVGIEVFSLLSGAVVVRCVDGSSPVELAMSSGSLTGFLSWVESAPPGVPRA